MSIDWSHFTPLAALAGGVLIGIAAAIAFALTLIYTPFLHPIFGTAALSAGQLLLVAPFPLIVWGADELRRLWLRRRAAPDVATTPPPG